MARKKKIIKKEECCSDTKMRCSCGSSCGGVYGLGFIGAAVYYISNATGFWMGFLGLLKAIVWPVFLVFKLLGL